MKVTKDRYLYQLAFIPTLFPVNCYFVEETDSLTLIDAALPTSYKKILQTAKEIGKPITNILLTHAHSDHIGSLDALKHELPDVHVSISKRDARLLRGDMSILADEANLPIKGGVPKKIQTKPDQLLEEGDVIGSLQVIVTPGHTPGSISLLDTRTNAVIVGDAFQTRGGFAVAGTVKWTFPLPALATWNKQAAIESAQKIQALDPSLLAAGHGPMVATPAEAVKQAIQEAKERM